MRRRLTLLGVTLAIASLLAVPVLARGGNGNKAVDVCWIRPGTNIEVKANFQTTASGIVQQFRYEPEHKHGVFKPAAQFSEPDEGDWRLWQARNYAPCDPDADYKITDFLKPGTYYWVQLELQD